MHWKSLLYLSDIKRLKRGGKTWKTRATKNSTKLWGCRKNAAITSVRQAIKCPDDGGRVELEQRNSEKDFDRWFGDEENFYKKVPRILNDEQKQREFPAKKINHKTRPSSLFTRLGPLLILALPKTKTCFEGTQIWCHFWYATSRGERTKVHSRWSVPGMFWAMEASPNWAYWRIRWLLWRW